MTTLLLSLLLGAEVLSPPIPVQAASGASVQVAAEPGTIDVTIANQSVVAVWADQRRVEGLLTATQVLAPVADLWVRVLDGGVSPRLVCPAQSPVLSARVASTAQGRVGIAWRRGPLAELALSVLDSNLQFESGPCGRIIAPATVGGHAVVATGDVFRLAWETDAGVKSIGETRDGSVLVPPRLLFAGCTQPVLAETPDGSYAGALCDGGIALINGGVAEAATSNPATAFTLVPGFDGPVLLRVDAMGLVWLHPVASQSATTSVTSVAGRQPLGVNLNGAVLMAVENGGNTTLSSGGNGGFVQGTPAGLATSGPVGFVATRLGSGAVRGSEVNAMPGALALSTPESISTARVLQRRPSVAWSSDAQRWVLTWEEATGPRTWVARGALVQANSGVPRSVTLPATLAWPRVVRQPDGGVWLYGQQAQQTTVFVLSADGGSSAAGSIPFVARGVVTGATHSLWWSDGQPRRESNDGVAGQTITVSDGFEVSCAAWAGGVDGGAFVVTRENGIASAFSRFVDDGSPSSAQQTLQGQQACVSARAESSQVALLEQQPGGLRLTRSSDNGVLVSDLSADAGAFGLQLAPTSTGWLVAYNSDAGVFAVSVDDVMAAQPRYYRLDTTGVAHGNPSVAAAPTGAVAVTWASLIGDSVEVRLRVFEPAVTDAGQDAGDPNVDAGAVVDAGVVDAGVVVDAGLGRDGGVDAGMPDAGSTDAGVVDAGEGADAGVSTFVAVCGCGATDGSSLLLVMVVLAVGGMRRRG